MSYEHDIEKLAQMFVDDRVGYDNAIRSAQTIAERYNQDRSWSSVDFEDAVNKLKGDK